MNGIKLTLPSVSGRVSLIETDLRTGKRRVLFRKQNLVVSNFYEQIVYLIAGDLAGDPTDRKIGYMSFGENGAAPTIGDTTITNPYNATITSYSYPDSASVNFRTVLDGSEANGKPVQEAGLTFNNTGNGIAARINFPGVMTKNQYFSWEFNWTLSFGECEAPALNTLRTQLCHLLAGDSSGRSIQYMQFGCGAQVVDPTQTRLQYPIVPVKEIDSATFPSTYVVRFSASLDEDEGNGFKISEVGLMTGDGTIVARDVFGPKEKDEEHTLLVYFDLRSYSV